MTTVWSSIRDVLLPRGCAGCDAPDAVLCDDCRRLFSGTVAFPMPDGLAGEGYACASYRGAVRRAILGWKDHGDEECDAAFAAAIGGLAARTLPAMGMGYPPGEGSREPVLVVPAPSSASSMRRRGRRHVMPLARAVADALRGAGMPAAVDRALRTSHVRGRSVQTANVAERAVRVDGGIVVRPKASLRGRRVVLVDDIVTTGATVRQCAGVLARSGACVVTCLALARTPSACRPEPPPRRRYGISAA